MSRDKLMKFIFFCSHNFILWYPTGSIQNANVCVKTNQIHCRTCILLHRAGLGLGFGVGNSETKSTITTSSQSCYASRVFRTSRSKKRRCCAVFEECSIEGKTFVRLCIQSFTCVKKRDTFFVAVETVTKG